VREFSYPATVDDLIGDWYLVATTLGQFDTMLRVEGAAIRIETADEGRKSTITYRTRRRSWTFGRTVADGESRRGFSRWTGGPAGLVASVLPWQLAKTSDGSIIAAHNPGSMMVNEGIVFLARSDLSERAAVASIRREQFELGLGVRELDTLSWRVGAGRIDSGA
jgi:hypothetical protein